MVSFYPYEPESYSSHGNLPRYMNRKYPQDTSHKLLQQLYNFLHSNTNY